MILSHKAKQYLLLALKVSILIGMCWFIYHKISAQEGKPLEALVNHFNNANASSYLQILIWIVLAFLNWGLEARKWQQLARTTHAINYATAWKQTYGSLTASLITPQRVGEYGAKALYFPTGKRRRILWLTFVGNAAQMLVTLVFGLGGLSFSIAVFKLPIDPLNIVLVLVVLLLLSVLGYLFRERELLIQGFSISNLIKKTKELTPTFKTQVFLISALRYLCFGSLFYLILNGLGAQIELQEAGILICSYYILISVTPMLFVFDIVVKGGIALWLFSLAGTDSTIVLAAVLLSWILNFALPAFIGSYFVIRFKTKEA